MSSQIINPYPLFLDLQGNPLQGGLLYFGVANQNPETSPITVYWDGALTQPAAQPISTINGFPARSGTPAQLFISSTYSVTVKDSTGALVSSTLTSANPAISPFMETVLDDLTEDEARETLGAVGLTGNETIAGLKTFSDPVLFAAQTGGEGGEFRLQKGTLSTLLSGNDITFDVVENKLRIFESIGAGRGVYIPLADCAAAIGTNLLNPAGFTEFTSTATPTLDLTGVPGWATRITVLIEDIASTTAAINLLARLIGTTTPSTAYLSWGTRNREFSATVDTISLTSGFLVKMLNDAAGGISGKLVFEKYLPGTNRWIYTGNVYGGGDSSNNHAVGRNINNPGPVTGIQLLPASGNWTAGGKVLLMWE